MPTYLINLHAEFSIYSRQKQEHSEDGIAVGEIEDGLVMGFSGSRSEENPNLFIGSIELQMPAGGEGNWGSRAESSLRTILGGIMDIEEIELHSTSMTINQQALEELAEKVAAELHTAWQNENREIYSVRRKATEDEEWVEKAMENALTVRLTTEQATDLDADKLQLELEPGQAAILQGPKGERLGVYVDIMNTEYQGLPGDWQEANRVSAAGAAQLIAQSIMETGAWDMETIAEQIHQQWLEANPWAKDGEQGRPFAELSEEDQERDRSVARVVARNL
jgi:hypothetical protein